MLLCYSLRCFIVTLKLNFVCRSLRICSSSHRGNQSEFQLFLLTHYVQHGYILGSMMEMYISFMHVLAILGHNICLFLFFFFCFPLDSARNFWQPMVQQRWALTWPMECFLSAHGSDSFTMMVRTFLFPSQCFSFELLWFLLPFYFQLQRCRKRRLPTFG